MLLPVRDGGPRLDGCLDSLAAQTLADHEVIAVDDGSTDGSGERLLARARLDPRLRVVRTPPRGLVAALMLGLGEARAAFVARMDADDVAHPERLHLQLARLEGEPGLDVLGCRVAVSSDPGTRPGAGMAAYVDWSNGLLDHETLARERFVEAPLVHPSVVLRATAMRRLGGWREGPGPEDYDLWLRGFAAGLRFAKLPQVLLEWHDSPRRLTRRDPRYGPARFLETKLDALARGPLSGRAAVVWGAGPIGKRWTRALLARGHEVSAFVEVNPRKLGTRIAGIPVLDAASAARLPALHLAAVGQPGARDRIRHEAARHGLRDGETLFAVA